MQELRNGAITQGDLLIEIVEGDLPKGLTEAHAPKGGELIVGHSETGHHHLVREREARLLRGDDPFVCYLMPTEDYADLIHDRPVHPHDTVRIIPPDGHHARITRQREWTPQGDRAIQD